MVDDESAEATYIDEALMAISEGDKEGAMALLECVNKARALRKAKATPRRASRRTPRRELAEA